MFLFKLGGFIRELWEPFALVAGSRIGPLFVLDFIDCFCPDVEVERDRESSGGGGGFFPGKLGKLLFVEVIF